jgi:hypothetical protein
VPYQGIGCGRNGLTERYALASVTSVGSVLYARLHHRTRSVRLKIQEGLAHDTRKHERSWEPMTLTPVGNLGAVIQDMSGSFSDSKGQKMSMA